MKDTPGQTEENEQRRPPIVPIKFSELAVSHPHLRPPIIEGPVASAI